MSAIVTHDGNALVLDPSTGTVVSAPSIFEARREIVRRAANSNSAPPPPPGVVDKRGGANSSRPLPARYSHWLVRRSAWWRA